MPRTLAWAVFALGAIHIVFGLVRFREPLLDAWAAGFAGQLASPDVRRTAFWFILAGPLIMLAGHLCVHAVNAGDLHVLKLVGTYLLVVSLIGVIAFPVSPLWAPLVLAPLLIAAGYGKL